MTSTTNRTLRRVVFPLMAAGLAGAVLPLTAGSAHADTSPSASPSAGPSASPSESPSESPSSSPSASPTDAPSTPASFSGYSGEALSTPLKLEIFEPTIPIPTSPQLEVDFGYSKIGADSTGTTGRASYLWPGDPIGEGEKTFIEALGLPEALGAAGYPAQVNASYPSDTTTQAQEPFPGTVMRTTAGPKKVEASAGYSSNCDVADGDGDPGDSDGSGGSDGSGSGGSPVPGLPALPTLPALPGLPSSLGTANSVSGLLGLAPLEQITAAAASARAANTAAAEPSTQPGTQGTQGKHHGKSLGTSRGRVLAKDSQTTSSETSSTSSADDTGSDATCPVPAELDAVVDLGGYVSDSTSNADSSAATTGSRTALGDVKLLGGLITLSGVTAKAVTTSDGEVGKATGQATYGTLTIAGVPFKFGPDGLQAASQTTAIPGLPDDPNAALATLGVNISIPKPVFTTDGSKAQSTVEGLVVTIDMKTLSPVLSKLQLGPILDQLPFPPQAAPLKSLLGAAGQLSPKFVVHLGYATSKINTVQALAAPTAPVPDNDPSASPSASAGGATTNTGGGSSGTAAGSGLGAAPAGGAALGTAPTTDATAPLPSAALSSGLPKLFSIPGLLLVGGVVGALVAGNYVRRIGALVLGAGGACVHGLDSGLPDLRKVQ